MPHINILDYIAWPAFREYAVQIPSMQHGMMWLMDMSLTLRCDWQSITDLALCQNEETELWDLCHAAKVRGNKGSCTCCNITHAIIC
jgi:hypothetical protein